MSVESIKDSLDKNFFAKVIEKSFELSPDEFKVISIDSTPATAPGDNCLSEMLRSKVEVQYANGDVKQLSYVVKAQLASYEIGAMTDIAVECQVFRKEQMMYSEIIPQFEKFYSDVGVEFSFGPKCYYTTNDPVPIIVMEDLSTYKMLNRRLGFDEDKTRMGLDWMAKFHAASMVFEEKIGPYEEFFKSGLFTMKADKSYQSYLDEFIGPYTEAMKLHFQDSKIASKIEKWRGTVYSSACEVVEFDENAFNVLNHGDPWSNNFMFHSEEDQIKNVKLVDYQLPFWGSVAFDLFYFSLSTWHVDFKIKKFDEMIKFYFDSLIENLKLLKYKKKLPTYENLEKELSRKKFLGKFSYSLFFISILFYL